MRVLSFDTETSCFGPGMMAPEITCLTWQSATAAYGDVVEATTCVDGPPLIVHWTEAEPHLRSWFEDKDTLIVGQNVAYDMAVLCAQWPHLIPLIFQAYEEDRVTCSMLRAKLIDIAQGCYRGEFESDGETWRKYGYSLFDLARRFLGRTLKKDGYRMRYGELRDIPIADWGREVRRWQEDGRVYLTNLAATGIPEKDLPVDVKAWAKDLQAILIDPPEQVVIYPLDDARTTLDLYLVQEQAPKEWLVDQFRQARAAFALHLSSAWGLRTHKPGVDALRAQTEAAIADVKDRLVAAGIVRTDGSRDTKKAAAHMIAVCERGGLPLRKTPGGGASLDEDACLATEDPLLADYAEFSTLNKTLTADVPMLEAGTASPIHTRYDLAETGRTTASGPNIQNLRRLPGIRESFVPRAGYVVAENDYPSLELFTLAQSCMTLVGHSALADALNGGLDPHTALAADILGITYDEAIKRREAKDAIVDDARQTSKVANFGFPGGLGVAKFVLFARKSYGVELTEARAKELKKQWLGRWPEMKEYFELVNRLCSNTEKLATVSAPFTGRIRGRANYCAACNSFFQGLGADCAKNAAWLLAKACYVDRSSPLFGSRVVAFVHDEFLIEVKNDEHAHDAAQELAQIMCDAANVYLPDVPIPMSKMQPLLMTHWAKGAYPVFDANKRLIPWTGKKAA